MLSALVTTEDCAAHPPGVHGRCRHCGSPEGSDHAPDCSVYTANPLRDDISPSAVENRSDDLTPVQTPERATDAPDAAPATPPAVLTEQDVKVLVPSLKPGVKLVLLGERIYLRDGDEFRLLGNGAEIDLLRSAQIKIAEGQFLEAMVSVWRRLDELAGGQQLEPLVRAQSRAAWETYRDLLDA